MEWKKNTTFIPNIWHRFSYQLDNAIAKIDRYAKNWNTYLDGFFGDRPSSSYFMLCLDLTSKSHLLKSNFWHIFALPSSSRNEKRFEMFEIRFIVFNSKSLIKCDRLRDSWLTGITRSAGSCSLVTLSTNFVQYKNFCDSNSLKTYRA